MAQGCSSVVLVCATSYSWTTGPHWGAMESPQTAAGTREPATPMVAVPAENGSTNLAGIRSPGIGPDGRLVQMSAKIPLRGCEPLGFRRWVANFKDCASKAKLNGLLQSRPDYRKAGHAGRSTRCTSLQSAVRPPTTHTRPLTSRNLMKNATQIRKHDAILAVLPPAVVLFRPGLRHGPLRDKSSDASDPRHAGRRRRRLPPQQLRRVTQQEAEAAKCGGSCTPTAHRQGRATAAKNQAGGWVSSAHAGTGLAPAHMMPASSPCRSDMLRSAYVILLLVVGLWNNYHDDACDVGRGPQARVSCRKGPLR